MKYSLRTTAARASATAAFFCLALAAHAQPAGTLYGFGDSLSDDGNLPKYLGINYPPPPYYKNHFSNGPVFLEYLPALTGLSFSPADDYAVGGAFADAGSLLGALVPGVSLQIQAAATAGVRFHANDVVSVWAGANNYFSLLGSVGADATIADPTVQSTIRSVAGAVTSDVSSVINLGARRVVVLNVPNLGATPSYSGSSQATLATQIAQLHNSLLPGEIAALQKRTGVNIYYIDAYAGLQEILANPGRLGITNTTQECILVPACKNGTRAQQDTFLFWDDVHPTTGVQENTAQIIGNQLNAQYAIAGQGQLILADSQDFATAIDQRLAARRAADPDRGKFQIWLQGHYAYGSRSAQTGASGFHYETGSMLAGADYAIDDRLVIGGAFGWGQPRADFGGDAGKLAYDAYQGALYADWHEGGAFANVTGQYGRFVTNTASRPSLPGENPLNFSPDANAYGVTLGAGYMFPAGALRFGPVAGLARSHADIEAYSESGEPLIVQHVDGQGIDGLTGRLGLSATYGAGLPPWMPRPTISVAVEREFLDGSRDLTSSFLSAGLPIHTTLPGYVGTYGSFGAGVSEAFTPNLSGTVDFATTFSRQAGNDRALLVKITGTF